MDAKYCTRGLILVAIALVAVSAVVAFPAVAQSEDRFEPNDHSGEAAEIEPGTTYADLRMAEDEWADYYAIDAEEGENVSALAAFDHDTADLDVALITPDKRFADFSFSNSDNEAVHTTAESDGTYYVVVYGFGSSGADYDLSVDVLGQETRDDGFEDNDQIEEAAPIEPGEYENLTVNNGDRDFYTVQAEAGDQIVAASQIYSADADLTVYVHGPNDERFATSSGTEWRPAGIVANESGTHYVVVTSQSSDEVSYDLNVGVGQSDRFDPNEDEDSLSTVKSGAYSNLSLVAGPDVDSYQVELVQGERLDVSTIPAGDTTAELFLTNEDGDLLTNGSSGVYGDGAGLDYSPNETGTYTVNVVSEDGSATTYDLNVSVSEADRTYGDGVYENETVSAGDSNRYDIETVDGGDQLAVATRAANQSDDLYLRLEARTEFITSDSDGIWDGVGHVPDDDYTSYEVLVRTESDEPVTYDLYVDDGAADRFDPNEGDHEAAAIEAGTHENLSIVGPADTDYYEIDLEQGQEVSIESELSAGKPVDLWVSGPEDEQVEVSTSGPYSSDESVSFTAESNGTYTVQAYNDDVTDHDGSTYDLEVEVEDPEPVYGDGVYQNQTVTNDSPNYYNLESVNESELVAIATKLESSEDDLSLRLNTPFAFYQDSQGVYWRSIEAAPDSGGSYVLRVTTTSAEPVEYDLHLATGQGDQFDPNGNEGQATELDAGSYGNLTIIGTGDKDYYAVDLEAGESVTATVTSDSGPQGINLFASGPGDIFTFGMATTNGSEVTFTADETGVHYLEVYGVDDHSFEYEFDVNVSSS